MKLKSKYKTKVRENISVFAIKKYRNFSLHNTFEISYVLHRSRSIGIYNITEHNCWGISPLKDYIDHVVQVGVLF